MNNNVKPLCTTVTSRVTSKEQGQASYKAPAHYISTLVIAGHGCYFPPETVRTIGSENGVESS